MDLLLVEDDIDLQKVLAQYLELSGFTVYTANHGEHGLRIFKEKHVDLCILDVMMPDIEDGLRCYRLFKSDEKIKRIPVIMLSAIARKTFFHAISRIHLADGTTLPEPDAYMEKPPDAGELSLAVSEVLQKTTPDTTLLF